VTTDWTVTFDAVHPPTLAAFWALALGYEPAPPPRGFTSWDEWYDRYEIPEHERDGVAAVADPEGTRPRISFLQVPEGKTAKNRVHLDLQVGGRSEPWETRRPKVEATVARLVEAGATQVAVVADEVDGTTPDHVVMQDPEGNEFCVI
jgi:hypothetical protein